MPTFIKILIILAVIGGAVAGAGVWTQQQIAIRNKPNFTTARIDRGDLREVVNASGEVKPVLEVHVGSFVSGPVKFLYADFNDEVEKDQVLARIDPRIIDSEVAAARASLSIRNAEVVRAKAQLQQAINDERRAFSLHAESEDYISQSELDQYRFAREALEAQVLTAEATVEQAAANLKNAEANQEYTYIRAPESGIIMDRLIEPGQTLASSFQTPELFIIAPRMREKMHIFASINEAEIGKIQKAKADGEPVSFIVDAYPGISFQEGVIEQIRLSSNNTQNVVTYPVVVATPNPDLKLLPGMTANLTFQIDKRDDVLRIPNTALRFLPEKKLVHEDDQSRLDLTANLNKEEDKEVNDSLQDMPADERAEARRNSRKRTVWRVDGDKLRAVDVVIGIKDYKFTEILQGDLKVDDEVVISVKVGK